MPSVALTVRTRGRTLAQNHKPPAVTMKRREFCTGATAALAGLSLAPWRRAHSASEVAIVGLDGGPRAVTSREVEELRAGLRGELLAPGDAGYDAARRLWN